jgi:penicillin G amidase
VSGARPAAGRLVAAFVALAFVVPAALPARQDEASALRARAAAALSQTTGEIRLAGLEQPVDVIRDRWGVPHIYAKSVHDLFFAQGFVAAGDRLWQLDLWRRMAEGTLAEVVGPTVVNRDVLARLLRYRGDPAAEWQAYRPDARAIVEAFVEGVNAQVGVATASPDRLPLEFQLTGTRPGRWTKETVIGRMAGFLMTRNARTEADRARLVRRLGPDAVTGLDPATKVTVPDGLDLADITDEILALTAGASETVNWGPGLASRIANLGGQDAGRQAEPDPAEIGSNDWVVAGRHTATGRPLLANDPHRTIMLPSLRYTVHLNGPGWNVIGAGEPALPGIAAGHNDRIAFGFTIVGMDQQDLYVERLDPADPEKYVYRGASEPMRVERETVAVHGEAPREIELRFTRHGPVLHLDRARLRAYALRWVGAEPGGAGYLKSLAIDTAGNWSEFRGALAGWKVPSENLVYADVDGNIGWVAAGLAPIRPNWNGLLPVPGHEGKYEWSGFVPLADLPQSFNPASGFIATANHNVLPAGYPHVLGFEFGAPFRFERILEVLRGGIAAGRRFTVDDFGRLQHDEQSVVAKAVVGALARARAERPPAAAGADRARAIAMLTAWDGTLAKDSAAAALYEAWMPKLRAAVAARAARPTDDRAGAAPTLTDAALLRQFAAAGLRGTVDRSDPWVDGTPRCPGCRPPETPDASLRATLVEALTGPSLDEAWRDVAGRLGADASAWAWGRMHRASFEHPLAVTPALKAVLNPGDVPRGGDATTPNATGAGARQTAGASFREVLDVSNWDNSVTVNVPGLSGQPGSPHYADLLPLWADGRYHALPFSRAAVERFAAERLRLVPAGGRAPR